jgi:hypothetical protein
MIAGTMASKILLTVAAANIAAAVISSEWAIPMNTLLLVILALVSRSNGKKLDETKDHLGEKVDDAASALGTKLNNAAVDATHVASAAAAAAASAATAARISKEIGGALRGVHVETDPPAPPSAAA